LKELDERSENGKHFSDGKYEGEIVHNKAHGYGVYKTCDLEYNG